jgi:anthranilate phosphoribosyltransferase
MDDLKSIIAKVATGATLSREEAASAFDRMMSGEATPSQLGGLLMALRVRGETIDEITGAVSAMRAKMLKVKAPPNAIDVVGTGGDGSGSVNVSTCAARRQAWQPRAVIAFRRGGRPGRAWREDRPVAGTGQPLRE